MHPPLTHTNTVTLINSPCTLPTTTHRYQWNLKDFLPEALQQPLVVALTEFIYNPWKEAAGVLQRGASQGGSQAVQDARSAEDKQVGGWGRRGDVPG